MSLPALPAKNKPQSRRLSTLLAAVTAFAVCAAASGKTTSLSAPTDLVQEAKAAAAQGKPLVILVSMAGCAFCDVVRRNYLLPLTRTSAPTNRPLIREVDMTSAISFLGFDGKSISSAQFAKSYAVQVAPTVLFFGPSGQQLAAPIVGGDVAGMYSAYLENAFVEASRKLSIARQPIKEEKE